MSTQFFMDLNNQIIGQRPKNSQVNSEKERGWMEKFVYQHLVFLCVVMVMKAVWHWHKGKQKSIEQSRDPWNGPIHTERDM